MKNQTSYLTDTDYLIMITHFINAKKYCEDEPYYSENDIVSFCLNEFAKTNICADVEKLEQLAQSTIDFWQDRKFVISTEQGYKTEKQTFYSGSILMVNENQSDLDSENELEK